MNERHKNARAPLGHTEQITFKVHPDLAEHIRRQAEANYCSPAEYVRHLIIADMKLHPTKEEQ